MSTANGRRRDAIVRRQAEVLRLRTEEALDYREIGVRLKISHTQAHRDYLSALRDQVPAHEVAEMRKADLLKLEQLERDCRRILQADHPKVHSGRVVRDERGQSVLDEKPKLMAIGTLLEILKQRARMLGLNAPTRVAMITEEAVTAEVEVKAQAMNVDLDALRQLLRAHLDEIGGSGDE